MNSSTCTLPPAQTRPKSLRSKSISMTCSARSFSLSSKVRINFASSSAVAPRGLVPRFRVQQSLPRGAIFEPGGRCAQSQGDEGIGAARQGQTRLDLAGQLVAEVQEPTAAERQRASPRRGRVGGSVLPQCAPPRFKGVQESFLSRVRPPERTPGIEPQRFFPGEWQAYIPSPGHRPPCPT